MTKHGTLTLTGQSGTEYPFNVYSLDSYFGEVSAVYVVTKRYMKGDNYSHTIIYIGQTDNLKERFDNHHKQVCFDENDANTLCVHQELSEKTRLTIETDLIEAYSPSCND